MVRVRDVVLCMFPLGTAYLLIALLFSTYTAPRRANDVFRTLPVRRSKKQLLQIAAVRTVRVSISIRDSGAEFDVRDRGVLLNVRCLSNRY